MSKHFKKRDYYYSGKTIRFNETLWLSSFAFLSILFLFLYISIFISSEIKADERKISLQCLDI